MELEVRHLKLVRAVSALGGLTPAGRELNLSQSALSHQLRDAETRLGARLFSRVGKRMVLTTAGECLLRSAGEILDTLERTEAAIRGLAGGCRGRLRLSIGGYTQYHWLPAVMKAFRAACPEAELQIVAGLGRDLVAQLVEGAIDVALIDHDVGDARVTSRWLFDDEVVVIMEPRHALASRRWIEPADFSYQTLIVEAPLDRHAIYQRLLTPAGVSPAGVQLVAQTAAIIELVKAGAGIATIARWAIEPIVGHRRYSRSAADTVPDVPIVECRRAERSRRRAVRASVHRPPRTARTGLGHEAGSPRRVARTKDQGRRTKD